MSPLEWVEQHEKALLARLEAELGAPGPSEPAPHALAPLTGPEPAPISHLDPTSRRAIHARTLRNLRRHNPARRIA